MRLLALLVVAPLLDSCAAPAPSERGPSSGSSASEPPRRWTETELALMQLVAAAATAQAEDPAAPRAEDVSARERVRQHDFDAVWRDLQAWRQASSATAVSCSTTLYCCLPKALMPSAEPASERTEPLEPE